MESDSENLRPKNWTGSKPKEGFAVNLNLIEEVQQEDQDEEIQNLGLSVYRQETLEQGILQQVDEALERQEKEQEEQNLDSEIACIETEIRVAEEQVNKDQSLLRVLLDSGALRTQMVSIRKEQEDKRERLQKLKARQKALLQQKYSLYEPEVQDCQVKEKEEETAEEKMIRLGEMTPFGTMLASKTSSEMSGLKKYFAQQAASSKDKAQSVANKKQKSSPLKRNILMPQKRKKKIKLGTKTSKSAFSRRASGPLTSETQTMWLDDDPDFVPSGDEEDDLDPYAEIGLKKATRKRKIKEVKSESDWHTDDSDWEKSPRPDTKKSKRKSMALDDGSLEDYEARVSLWREQGGCEEEELHKLDGYLEIPMSIWNKLYKYQQVGVQWMWELYQNGSGGVLGDEMGLGKTIQVIAFLAALKVSRLKSKNTGFRGLGPTILVCPTTVMHQWVSEFHTWWPPIRVAILHESGSSSDPRTQLVKDINRTGGVLVTSYQGLVSLQETLLQRRWHLLILDEGHKIRNPDAQATLAAKRIPTPHRLALTGSPMQNNLKELWSLFDFVYPSKLGTLPDFLANFAVPITQGGYANASEVQVATAFQCALTLKETIKPYLLRRMKADVKNHIMLPPKNEQVLFCKLTDEQRNLYHHYVNSNLVGNILSGRLKIFVGLINLRKICNHPDLFGCGANLDDETLPEEERYGYWKRSGKMLVVQQLLKIWQKQGHRVLLFTQGRQMMCILENFLNQEKYKYLKLDGTTSISSRQPLIKEFNNNPEHFIFLLTTRVGGLGVNLTGANRVIIFDPDWNPATDTQARERAWRIGQKNQVTVYRLVTTGTIEEKIYHRQIFKQFLTNKVLKNPKQRRFFKSNDLFELFTLNEGKENSTETSAIFAGTGSEVAVPRKKDIKMAENDRSQALSVRVQFSEDKIAKMRELAARLSKQITNKSKGEENSAPTVKTEPPDGSEAEKKKTKKPKKKKWCKFEGERVENLVKQRDYASLLVEEESETKKPEHQDDYVLRKLFKKTGLQTALKHDKIMDGGGSDYALVEREARHVAEEAVARLKESQQKCFSATSGIPTWTGSSGHMRSPNSGKKSKEKQRKSGRPSAALGKAPDGGKRSPESDVLSSNPSEQVSADDILSIWNQRNRLIKPTSPPHDAEIVIEDLDDEPDPLPVEEPLFAPDIIHTRPPPARESRTHVTEEESELLDDLRCFLAFGGAIDGQATTSELLERFQKAASTAINKELSPLFKFLLKSIATFHRDASGLGIWRLKPEFKCQ
ncbi:DNA excision repair protein ERCC-6-like [Neocloeon triangulifer]|uniref:DNA excision repair protein ERCC-6-like n=1 Tax=Neocloeon triangulifer TaxID=2078957 RepID=UPI00286F310B|nr:DNA excision repair protein ERCC-6-like [Neocloeon triangulifer]